MAKNGKGLAVIALIIALIGVGAGGFMIITQYILTPEEEPYVVPAARVFRTGSYSLVSWPSAGNYVTFNYTDKSYDTHDAFNLEMDHYETPEPGFYHVVAQYCIEVEFEDFFKIEILINGEILASRSYTAAKHTNTFTVSVSDIINASLHDLISIKVYSYNAATDSRAVFPGDAYTFFTIIKTS